MEIVLSIIEHYNEELKEKKNLYEMGLATTREYHQSCIETIDNCIEELVQHSWSKSTATEIVAKML